ncbi:MAG: hypothetical protein GF409_01005 [Candidatus Omnitrophica bacterium]|nr:hypothetical protein [Candidatus Omnitrophota bacterium]
MGLKKRKKIKAKQKKKRHKKRMKLAEEGLDPNDYYFGKYYVGSDESEEE